ncbi:MAG: hypothetical protein PHS57_07450 [Alphaproteobacteria bacterium]|nr:hypothetical protein [Alphaproteobacteria bacterium]
MSVSPNFLIRVFSPRVVYMAIKSFDRSTAVIIGLAWAVACLMLFFASLSIRGVVDSKREALLALAQEPVLPKITTAPIRLNNIEPILSRLKRQFPEINIDQREGKFLTLRSNDGALFHQWISALSYIDSMTPEIRWDLREFCVGACGGGGGLMSATLVGREVSISLPPK